MLDDKDEKVFEKIMHRLSHRQRLLADRLDFEENCFAEAEVYHRELSGFARRVLDHDRK
jgi:hypothetical protein